MITIIMKSGHKIEVDETFVKKYMESAIEEYVEKNHSYCSCSLNESNPCCDCDGDLTEDNFIIREVQTCDTE